ncbi:hypothetical protein F511_25757 [Dorcoceras hygrometricum]|uniref:Uncharacterized protein n=1 Tax=Dorcoceras hygrometricum TaxID=472368 RepID=A0A2Z7CIK5_9LAMI|nr:hypothetical protein F511_25757 [Dorcoceras hygrometricum]
MCRETINTMNNSNFMTFIGCFEKYPAGTCAWLQPELQERRLFTKAEGFYRQQILLEKLAGTSPASGGGGGRRTAVEEERGRRFKSRIRVNCVVSLKSRLNSTLSRIKGGLGPAQRARVQHLPKTLLVLRPEIYTLLSPQIGYHIHACLRAVNSRQRCIDSYMHRGLIPTRRLMTPSESENGSNVRPVCNVCTIAWQQAARDAAHRRPTPGARPRASSNSWPSFITQSTLIMAHSLLSTAQHFARGRWTRRATKMRNQCAGAAVCIGGNCWPSCCHDA